MRTQDSRNKSEERKVLCAKSLRTTCESPNHLIKQAFQVAEKLNFSLYLEFVLFFLRIHHYSPLIKHFGNYKVGDNFLLEVLEWL